MRDTGGEKDSTPRLYLSGSEGHLAMLAFAQLSELVEDGGQLFRQGRVWATELILWGTKTESKWLPSARRKQASTHPHLGGGVQLPQVRQLLSSLSIPSTA